ncbi:hypothetical protein ATE84_4955 [Aquimarina sp. MAR_2010_214]|uniref:hypothetical protein n=1 Tax=Aquimarina sp. MAR_2010_214 TaxID=1250026 RepID=UPI000C71470D|nr:hypothetical protein [Aquimarina sp. MAR_2010_214]PKV52827.1 hypothetical protein ATE84_4955 [Aquimarina sp. MAR_2010_214]
MKKSFITLVLMMSFAVSFANSSKEINNNNLKISVLTNTVFAKNGMKFALNCLAEIKITTRTNGRITGVQTWYVRCERVDTFLAERSQQSQQAALPAEITGDRAGASIGTHAPAFLN